MEVSRTHKMNTRNALDFKRVDLRGQFNRAVLIVRSDFRQLFLQALDLVVHNADALSGFLRTTSVKIRPNLLSGGTHLLDLVNID